MIETPARLRGTTLLKGSEPPKHLRDVLHTRGEVAQLAKVCLRTIVRDVRVGWLEEIRFNRRRIRYGREAVEAYLAGKYPLKRNMNERRIG